ncbi:hypothetical protein [Microbacterium testaceum]|nr:hypothetical protein [Microbacterium testaceum]
MSDSREYDADPELISRLRVIEEQPLDARAEAYAALHDELVRRLESGPTDDASSAHV